MAHIRPWSTVESALRASDAGVPDRENAEQHGVAIKTVRRWRREYQRLGRPRGQTHLAPPCPRCDGAPLAGGEYTELLGWYLGDGHIVLGRRGVYDLHIYDDERYTADIARIQDLMRAVKPGGRPHVRRVRGSVVITTGWKHWPCLFPQHGPGRKHERPIVLESWQRDLVAAGPGPFLRGLFHSDGCRVHNWATRTVRGERRRHDYPRWQFSNRSEDIHGLCTWALDLAGIPWRRSGRWTTSVSRREGVAELDRLIGPKS